MNARKRAGSLFTTLLAAAGMVVAINATAVTAGATPAASPTMITTTSGPFGEMLIVGSGKYAGYTLYILTSDQPGHYACTATIVKALPGGPGSCAGPSNDKKAEWPALTTTGAPVAGPGVNAKLLGAVQRSGIGDQVTYNGYPLYLFDQGAGQVTGEEWDEPSLPPWHGVWYLVSPSGAPLAWPGVLTTVAVGHKSVLAALMFTGAGWERFPVYSYSKDSSSSSACSGTCAVNWPPLLTSGKPAAIGSAVASEVGSVKRSDGTTQASYGGKPLYLFGYEGIAPAAIGFAATGNGAGIKVGGGTFELVAP